MGILLRVPQVGGRQLAAALAALQTLNELWLSEALQDYGPESVPWLYDAGIRYVPEDATEEWLTWPDLLRLGIGDCEDLAAARASELRVRGVDRGARAMAYQSGPRTWHSVVQRGDGMLEDPSLLLGMGWHPGIIVSAGGLWP